MGTWKITKETPWMVAVKYDGYNPWNVVATFATEKEAKDCALDVKLSGPVGVADIKVAEYEFGYGCWGCDMDYSLCHCPPRWEG